ncbi:hypothetical protein GCM10010411_93180 [Actinomadura fulvescens]|uniref:Uncharacterized protein n=1 Tax=Actinomadura fulvescens TaxID=46160 RepID=A0ABN3QYA9_9ACTN
MAYSAYPPRAPHPDPGSGTSRSRSLIGPAEIGRGISTAQAFITSPSYAGTPQQPQQARARYLSSERAPAKVRAKIAKRCRARTRRGPLGEPPGEPGGAGAQFNTRPYGLDEADRALADLAADRFTGAAVLVP